MPNVNTLDEECNNACRDLPDGYDLTIFLEKGAGWIELMDPDGEIVALDLDDMTLAEQVRKAIDHAIEANRISEGKNNAQ